AAGSLNWLRQERCSATRCTLTPVPSSRPCRSPIWNIHWSSAASWTTGRRIRRLGQNPSCTIPPDPATGFRWPRATGCRPGGRPSSTGWSPDAMIFRSVALGACLLGACVSVMLAAQPAPAAADEPPLLAERVETGELPPASERLPADAQTVPTGFGADPAARY